MPDNLEQLSLKELGKLFPIILCKYNPEWEKRYLSEKSAIKFALGSEIIIRIHHFGSTCVPNLYSKPTIDILLEIREDADPEKVISALKGIGYLFTPQPDNPAPHMMFMKGYTPNGFAGQAYHVHVRYSGDWDELYFRDYLILHPDIAEEYTNLKMQLKEKFEHDREAYTQGKTDFIKRITDQARKDLGEKY
jgi:GrpB-like predicted nucleotidyltransferase (UPF0157 family)